MIVFITFSADTALLKAVAFVAEFNKPVTWLAAVTVFRVAKAPNPVTFPAATEFAVAKDPSPETSVCDILRPPAVIVSTPLFKVPPCTL